MKTIFRNIAICMLVVMLAFVGLPLSSAHAAAPTDLATPQPTQKHKLGTEFLEKAFAHQKEVLSRATKAYGHLDEGFPKLQSKIDKAKAAGLDVTKVQAALDAVKKNLTTARPLYDQAKTIVDTHAGFDANGKVTDVTAAGATVKSLHDLRKQVKDIMGESLKTLRDAIKALKETFKK